MPLPNHGTNSKNIRDNLVSTEYQPFDDGQPPVHFGERTGFQAVITSPWVMRWAAIPATYQTYRTIRKNSTVALARELAVSPILAAEWTVDADKNTPQEWKECIEKIFMPLRDEYLATALYYGDIDFGYQCWEKIVEPKDGYLKITRLKQLLHDITEICIGHKGGFIGVRQVGQQLGIHNSMHVGFRVEGSYLYGIPLLENIRQAYNWWTDCNEGARRYDRKIAGCHIIVEYPPGSCINRYGKEVENAQLAREVLDTLESAGGVAIPRDMAAFMQALNLESPGWKIWIMDNGGSQQANFVERLNYLDKQLVRGIHIPERAMMEGVHGTLAEAEAHGDVIFTIQDIKHRRVTAELNLQAVNQMLYLNFGKQAVGKVRLKASPIADKQKAFFNSVYMELLGSPAGQQELQSLDLASIRQQLGLPTVPNDPGEQDPRQQGTPKSIHALGPTLQGVPGVSQGTPGGPGKQLIGKGPDGNVVQVDGNQPQLAQAMANALENMSAVALSASGLRRASNLRLTQENGECEAVSSSGDTCVREHGHSGPHADDSNRPFQDWSGLAPTQQTLFDKGPPPEPVPERKKPNKPLSDREHAALKEAIAVPYTSDRIVPTPEDFDANKVEQQLSEGEQNELDNHLNLTTDAAVADYDPDISDKDVAETAEWLPTHIDDKVGEYLDDNELDPETAYALRNASKNWYRQASSRTEHAAYGVSSLERYIKQHVSEDHQDPGFMAHLDKLRDQADDEMESTRQDMEDMARNNEAENYDTSYERTEWLRQFYNDNPERFGLSPEQLDKWGVDEDGNPTYHFQNSNGDTYNIDVSKGSFSGLPVHSLAFFDEAGSAAITGAGMAKEVFHHVGKAVLSYLNYEEPDAVYFTASDPSRISLYTLLARYAGRLTEGNYKPFMVPGATVDTYPTTTTATGKHIPNPHYGEPLSAGFVLVRRDKLAAYQAAAAKQSGNENIREIGTSNMPLQFRELPPATIEEVDAYFAKPQQESLPALQKSIHALGMGNETGLTTFRHKNGKGMLDRSAWNLSKLSEDEELELPELLDYGLQQPRDVPAGSTFYFTPEGLKRHARLIELINKASKSGGLVKTERESSDTPIWKSEDGQVALSSNFDERTLPIEAGGAGEGMQELGASQKSIHASGTMQDILGARSGVTHERSLDDLELSDDSIRTATERYLRRMGR